MAKRPTIREIAEMSQQVVEPSRLRQYIESRNLSVSEFARLCDISKSTVSRLLHGERKGSPGVFLKILAVCPDAEDIFVPRCSRTGTDEACGEQGATA